MFLASLRFSNGPAIIFVALCLDWVLSTTGRLVVAYKDLNHEGESDGQDSCLMVVRQAFNFFVS